MSDKNPFGISITPGKLRAKAKDTTPKTVARSDAAAEKHGFGCVCTSQLFHDMLTIY